MSFLLLQSILWWEYTFTIIFLGLSVSIAIHSTLCAAHRVIHIQCDVLRCSNCLSYARCDIGQLWIKSYFRQHLNVTLMSVHLKYEVETKLKRRLTQLFRTSWNFKTYKVQSNFNTDSQTPPHNFKNSLWKVVFSFFLLVYRTHQSEWWMRQTTKSRVFLLFFVVAFWWMENYGSFLGQNSNTPERWPLVTFPTALCIRFYPLNFFHRWYIIDAVPVQTILFDRIGIAKFFPEWKIIKFRLNLSPSRNCLYFIQFYPIFPCIVCPKL